MNLYVEGSKQTVGDKPMTARVINYHCPIFEELLSGKLRNIPGDIIEFGVFEGGMTVALAQAAPLRKVYALDTFEGMPAPEFTPELDHDEPGKFKPDNNVLGVLATFPNIVAVAGRFVYTLPTLPAGLQIALAYIDCDLYVSHVQALQWLKKHLVPGAVMVFDDYGVCKGARKAVDEFCQETGLKYDSNRKTIDWPLPKEEWYFF